MPTSPVKNNVALASLYSPPPARVAPLKDYKVTFIALAIIGLLIAIGLGVGVGFFCTPSSLGIPLGILIGIAGFVISGACITQHYRQTKFQNASAMLASESFK